MDYRRIGLARGGPQDWGQEAAAKSQGSANVSRDNPYSNVAQRETRDLNQRVARNAASNASKQHFQEGLKDFYKNNQGGQGFLGGIGNFFGGLGNKLGAWAGKMRGGINPATGEYYTQDEYKDNVQARRGRARIDRLARTRDVGKYANDPRGWQASDLSGRLGGLEKQFGIDQPVDARGLFEQEQGGIGATNVAQDLGGINGYTAEADPYLPGLEPINTMNNPTWNPVTQEFEYNMRDTSRVDDDISNLFAAEQLAFPGSENWTLGSGAATSGFPWSIWDQSGTGTGASPQSWIRPTGAQGGRVGYNTGGRVGILSIF